MSVDPKRRLLSIDLLDDDEHEQLDDWGNQAALTGSGPSAASIPRLFAEQVARAPDAVALVCGERAWTYRELDEESNRLAHLLAGRRSGARASVWRCCFRGPARRLWRSSRY